MREHFSFFCSWWGFLLFPISLSSFCTEPEWNHYKKRKNKEKKKKKDGPVGNTSVICSSHRHWTSARHFPAERRGEVGGRGGRKRGDFASHQIRFKKQNGEKKKAPLDLFPFFYCAEVKSSAIIIILLYYYYCSHCLEPFF